MSSGETELYRHRARLFVMREDKWVEKGLGDVKLLLNPVTGKTRLVMRKERTNIFIANHHVLPGSDLGPASSEADDRNRAFVYEVDDFSDAKEGRHETFALRFRSESAAGLFSSSYREAQVRNQAIDAAVASSTATLSATGDAAPPVAVPSADAGEQYASTFMSPMAPPSPSVPQQSDGSRTKPGGRAEPPVDTSTWDLGNASFGSDAGAPAASSNTGRSYGVPPPPPSQLQLPSAAVVIPMPSTASDAKEGSVSPTPPAEAPGVVGRIVLVAALGLAVAGAVYWARLPALGRPGRSNGDALRETARAAIDTAIRRGRLASEQIVKAVVGKK